MLNNLTKPWWWWAIAFLLILGIFFRFVNLDNKVYWHDEVYTSMRVSGYGGYEVGQQVFNAGIIGIEDLQTYQRLSPDRGFQDTLNALIEHPEHPPLYYLLLRGWMQLFGSSITAVRSLSAVISLLAFPCLYWLCWELFQTPFVGWMAIALFSVSPFHVLYAQEARQYSLWTVTILLSSAALLQALRLATPNSWRIYAATLVLGFYTILFFPVVTLSQGIYVILTETFRRSQIVKAYLQALLIGVLAFTPWLLLLVTNWWIVSLVTSWTSYPRTLSALVQYWGLHLNRLFIDFGWNISYPDNAFILSLLAWLVISAIYVLCRTSPPRVWLFVILLSFLMAIALILPDLLFGGQRSVSTRYFLPCYLGIQIAVAYLFYHKLTHVNSWKRKIWQAIALFLITLSVISCTLISQADTWWNKVVGYHNHRVASAINQSPRSLVITSSSYPNLGNLISLSYFLNSDVKFQMVIDPNIPQIPSDFNNVFLYYPSPTLVQGIEKEYGAKIEPLDANIPLLKVEINE